MSNDHQPYGPPWTILNTLKWTAAYFKSHHLEQPRPDAESMLAHVLECERIDLYLRYDQPLHDDELACFRRLIKRRVKREPVAYILGQKEFWSLSLKVGPAVLIPRPETECLVETILRHLSDKDQLNILELGAGSGAISIALAHERPRWRFYASDISLGALKLARYNARQLLHEDKIRFFLGQWFDPLAAHPKRFDVVVSNPPYIPSDDLAGLEPEVVQYEPHLALDGHSDGLASIRHIINAAPEYLKPRGVLFLEIGYDQRNSVATLCQKNGAYDQVSFDKDYSGHDRVAQLCIR